MHARQTEATDKILEQLRELDAREIAHVAMRCPELIVEQAAMRSTLFAVGDKVTYVKPGTGGQTIVEASVVKHHPFGHVTVASEAEGLQTMSAIYLRAAVAAS